MAQRMTVIRKSFVKFLLRSRRTVERWPLSLWKSLFAVLDDTSRFELLWSKTTLQALASQMLPLSALSFKSETHGNLLYYEHELTAQKRDFYAALPPRTRRSREMAKALDWNNTETLNKFKTHVLQPWTEKLFRIDTPMTIHGPGRVVSLRCIRDKQTHIFTMFGEIHKSIAANASTVGDFVAYVADENPQACFDFHVEARRGDADPLSGLSRAFRTKSRPSLSVYDCDIRVRSAIASVDKAQSIGWRQYTSLDRKLYKELLESADLAEDDEATIEKWVRLFEQCADALQLRRDAAVIDVYTFDALIRFVKLNLRSFARANGKHLMRDHANILTVFLMDFGILYKCFATVSRNHFIHCGDQHIRDLYSLLVGLGATMLFTHPPDLKYADDDYLESPSAYSNEVMSAMGTAKVAVAALPALVIVE